MYIVRTQQEIDEALNKAAEGIDQGSMYRAMTYEEGIRDAINWLTDRDADPLFE